jgi:hypothetical protein
MPAIATRSPDTRVSLIASTAMTGLAVVIDDRTRAAPANPRCTSDTHRADGLEPPAMRRSG